jgi:tetratricopeptide (TPR) repeat protein/TolB-like protein
MLLAPVENQTILLEQLGKLLNSNVFASTEKLRSFLALVVTKTVQGQGDHLKEYVVGVDALGKDADFNPQADASVRIHATRLRKLLSDYYSGEGDGDQIVISIPKGRYTPIFRRRRIGEPHDCANPSFINRFEVKKPTVVIFPCRGPFFNHQVEDVCKNLFLELNTELAKFNELIVLADNYDFLTRNQSSTAQTQVLPPCSFVLTGFYVCLNDRWKLTIELNDLVNRQIAWNESFAIGSSDTLVNLNFEGIVRKVVGTICGYMGIIYRQAIKTFSYNDSEYLYGIYWYNQYHQHYSAEYHAASLQAVEEGLKKYPGSAFLTAFKAQLLIDASVIDQQGEVDLLALGTQLAYDAVGLDMASQHAWMIVGWANLLNHRKDAFCMAMDKMVQLNPYNVMYYGLSGFALVCAGEYQRGFDIMTEATQLNPFYQWNLNVAFCFYYIHYKDYERALSYANLVNRKNLIWDPILRLSIHGLMESTEKCDSTIDNLYRLSPNFNERARFIIASFLWDKDLQFKILNGLSQAGIPIVCTPVG